MPAPKNLFKAALKEKRPQIGCWLAMAEAPMAEIVGTCGFDWLLIDGEHAPNDLRSFRDQLSVLEHSPSHAVVRIPWDEVWMVKQVLDLGAQTILVPMVETAEQAEALVRACRYPPHGVRGVGVYAARASQFGSVADYLATANDEICLLVQVETRKGIENIDAIAAVEGVDGVFIGPADLSADLGFLGQTAHPEVTKVIDAAFARICAAGKAPGILAPDLDRAQDCTQKGALFTAVGIDVNILTDAARSISAKARDMLL